MQRRFQGEFTPIELDRIFSEIMCITKPTGMILMKGYEERVRDREDSGGGCRPVFIECCGRRPHHRPEFSHNDYGRRVWKQPVRGQRAFRYPTHTGYGV